MEDTMRQTKQLLDYIAAQEESIITYNASDMKLVAHSDASYLSKPKARSRAGGHFFLSHETIIPQSRAQHGTRHQTCNDISNRSIISGCIHYGTRGNLHQNHIGRNGTPTAANPATNR